jgi:Lycopene cyclase protein
MDYRTSYITAAERLGQLTKDPTFLYAMPLGRVGDAPFSPDPVTGADRSVKNSRPGKQRVFFEETSLVARPALSMDECKQRLYERLKHHGIAVATVHEEEFCVIPMGGAYPKVDQRVVAFAGAGGLVHAATGYMQVYTDTCISTYLYATCSVVRVVSNLKQAMCVYRCYLCRGVQCTVGCICRLISCRLTLLTVLLH